MSAKKVLITGSHGFLGSALSNRFLSLGWELLRGDREGNIPEKVDLVIDCAAYGNLWGQNDSEKIFWVNYERVGKLLNQTDKYKQFIYTSTSSVTMHHTTSYALAKANGERLCEQYGATKIRPYTIYGGELDYKDHLIPKVFRSCLQGEVMDLDPSPTHDYIYIDDLVDLYVDPPSKLVEAGTGIATSNAEVVRLIQEVTGQVANITSLKEGIRPYDTLDWKAPRAIKAGMVSLREGLQRIYDRQQRLEA